MGISNNAQAILVTSSSVLICVGAYAGYTGMNQYLALALGLIGCVGLGLKEALGILTPAS